MTRKLQKKIAGAPDWLRRPAGASDISVSVDLEQWVVWPKDTFQSLLNEAIQSLQSQESPQSDSELSNEEIQALVEDVSEVAFSLSKDIAKKIHGELPRDRFSYLIEWDQTNSSQSVLISRIWGPATELARYQYFIARDVFSYIFANHLNNSNKERKEAVGSIVTRSLLVYREILTLCETGFPDGAIARWRTLYELQIILSAIKSIKGECYKYFVAAEEVATLRYFEAIEKRNGNKKAIKKLENKISEIKNTYGKQMLEDYGWAAIALGEKRVTFRDLEKIAEHEFQRPEYKYASRMVHGNHLEYVSLLGYPEWSGAQGPLIGPSPYGIEVVLQEAVRTLTFIIIEVLSFKNTLDTMVLMQIAILNRNNFEKQAKKAAKMMAVHTDNINNNWGIPR